MFGSYGALAREGVLGLNKRNGDYISRFNPRRLYPLVDDKLKTKRLALEAGIAAVAHLIFVFPELLLLVIAAALLAGRYTGYRLLELRRFKALRASGSTPSGSAT